MTINEVAEILSQCANKDCTGCRYIGQENCRDEKVKEMGEEVRKIAEGVRNDAI